MDSWTDFISAVLKIFAAIASYRLRNATQEPAKKFFNDFECCVVIFRLRLAQRIESENVSMHEIKFATVLEGLVKLRNIEIPRENPTSYT
jgi:hypothetical protein